MRVIGRVEGVGLVPRQAAGHLQQLADGDVRAPVAVPLRAQVVVVEGDAALLHEPSDQQVGHALGHRPAQLRGRGAEARRVPLRDELAVLHHDQGPGAQLRPVRCREVGAERVVERLPHGGRRFGSGRVGEGVARGVDDGGLRQVGPPVVERAAETRARPRGLRREHAEDAARGAVRPGRRVQHRHERVGRQVVLGIAATGDGGQRAGVVGGVPGAGEQQRPLPDVAAAHGQREQADDDEGDAPSRAHGEMINHRPRGGRAACPTPSRDRVDRSAWPGRTAR